RADPRAAGCAVSQLQARAPAAPALAPGRLSGRAVERRPDGRSTRRREPARTRPGDTRPRQRDGRAGPARYPRAPPRPRTPMRTAVARSRLVSPLPQRQALRRPAVTVRRARAPRLPRGARAAPTEPGARPP